MQKQPRPRKKPPPEHQAQCPSCHKKRDVNTQQNLLSVERVWVEMQRQWDKKHPGWFRYGVPENWMRECAITIGASGSWFWACDECIKTGRAVEADVRKHNTGLGTSYAAYVDREFECTDCNQSFAFSATEQQYWFEELGFLIWVYPKQCAPCRHLRRRKKGLQKSIASKLHALDPSDPTELAALAELYELYGCETKAREFYARAQNKRIVADRSITESTEP